MENIPSGNGHWTGGRFSTIEELFDAMSDLRAAMIYATPIEFSDGTYGIWMKDKD